MSPEMGLKTQGSSCLDFVVAFIHKVGNTTCQQATVYVW